MLSPGFLRELRLDAEIAAPLTTLRRTLFIGGISGPTGQRQPEWDRNRATARSFRNSAACLPAPGSKTGDAKTFGRKGSVVRQRVQAQSCERRTRCGRTGQANLRLL